MDYCPTSSCKFRSVENGPKNFCFPVTYKKIRNPGAQQEAEWHNFNPEYINDLSKLASEHGRSSQIFKNSLDATFSGHTLIPHDLKNLSRCLLTSAEFMLWERHWKKHLLLLADKYDKIPNGTKYTIQQLAGEGEFERPSKQIDTLPEEVLQEIANAAKTSFLLTPDDSKPTLHFSTIKQGVDESFIKFVDRLKDALEKQIDSSEAQKELLRKLALCNANEKCKSILRALPIDTEPTIEQMVESCTIHTSTENTVALAVSKGISQGVSDVFAVVNSKQNARCFYCGEIGHFVKDCPEKSASPNPNNNFQKPQKQQNKLHQKNSKSAVAAPCFDNKSKAAFHPNPPVKTGGHFNPPTQGIPDYIKQIQYTEPYRWEPGASW